MHSISATSGSFPLTFSLADVKITSSTIKNVLLPGLLNDKVTASAVNVNEGEVVAIGQSLLDYEPIQVNQLLEEAKLAVLAAQEAIYQFDLGISAAITQAEKALEDAGKALEKGKKQKRTTVAQLQTAVDQRQHDLDLLKVSGYYMGTTKEYLEWRLQCATEEVNLLRDIVVNGYQLLSQLDGYVLQRGDFQSGSVLSAGIPLFSILPADAEYQIELTLPANTSVQQPSGDSQLLLYKSEDKRDPLKAAFMSLGYSGIEPVLIMRPKWEDLSVLKQMPGYFIQLHTPFFPLLIPNEAFDKDGMVYLLKKTDQENVFSVSKLKVESQKGNERYTPVKGSLPVDALMIANPGSEISDGMQVFVIP